MSDKGYILPETIGDNPTTSFCMTIPDTIEYRAAFWGAVWNLGKWFSWQHGTPGDTRAKHAAQEWRDVLEPVYSAYLDAVECGGGGEPMLRQNPENPCVLQQSLDGGESWTTAFDYGLCLSPHLKLMQEAAIQQIAATGTPLAPGKSYIYSSGDTPAEVAMRKDALCYACYVVVELCMEIYQKTVDGDIDSINFIAGVLALLAALLPIGFASVPLIIVLAIAAASAVIFMIAYLIASFPDFDPTDAEMRSALRCAMYHHLLGRPLNESNFKKSFKDYVTCAPENMVDGAMVMDAILNNPLGGDLFRAFTDALGAIYNNIHSGEGVDCSGCVTGSWCYRWKKEDFLDDWEFWNTSGTNGGQLNTNPAAPTWLLETWSTVGNQALQFRMKNGIYIPATTVITGIRVQWCKWNGSHNLSGSYWNPSPGAANISTIPASGCNVVTYNFPVNTNTVIQPLFSINTNAGVGKGAVEVPYLEIFGTGEPPFGICNNCS